MKTKLQLQHVYLLLTLRLQSSVLLDINLSSTRNMHNRQAVSDKSFDGADSPFRTVVILNNININ